jgi:hypothetical protein
MTTQQTRGTKTTGQEKSYPAARQLATPTDLTEAEVQAITEALNPLVGFRLRAVCEGQELSLAPVWLAFP